MDIFIKATAGILIAVVLSIVLSKENKDISILLVIIVCSMVAAVAIGYLQKIMAFIEKLERIGNLNSSLIKILLKCVGIGLLSQITSMICTDSGNAAMGKVLQILASAVVLWLCVPLFTQLLELVENMMGAV